MKYQLLVFDWDGTLMDSEACIVACIQAAARDLGLPVPSGDRAKHVIGLGLNEAMARLFDIRNPLEVQKISDQYRQHFLGQNAPPEQLFPGIDRLFSRLQAAGYFLAVATGKSRRGLDRSLENSGLADVFHVTRCADETFSKPNPLMLNEIMDFVGVEAKNTLVIGDTEYDMQMAQNAGADAVAVSYGVHETEHLMRHGALTSFDNLSELYGWLGHQEEIHE